MKSKEIKPREILIVLLFIYAVLAGLMFVFPKEGVSVTEDLKFQFVNSEEFFNHEKVEQADISGILAQSEVFKKEEHHKGEAPLEDAEEGKSAEDKTAKQDTIKPVLFKLQFPENNPSVLHKFWRRMATARRKKKLVRIMHYGDSQIEADRITGFLRNKLQKEFGGSGPGLRSLKQAFDYRSPVIQQNEGSWFRYAAYGRRDTTLMHRRYGVLTSFARFSPHQKKPFLVKKEVEKADSIVPDSLKKQVEWVLQEDTTKLTKEYEASFGISKSRISYFTARKFKKARLFYGYNRRPVYLEAYNDETLKSQDSLPVSKSLQVKKWKFDDYTNNFVMKFKGYDSPDLFALALDDNSGIAVDNIAMRGSSGTDFRKIDQGIMTDMFAELNVGMLILQFGGNVTPYLKENYAFYEKNFYKQLLRLKNLLPGVAIIVIGPADMSKKEKDQYVSYENIPLIRDALRNATFRAGGAFWDMYEAMGGKNSMPSWVNHDPPLASKDFVHFNPKGARVIAEMFYKAFIEEYRLYQRQSAKK